MRSLLVLALATCASLARAVQLQPRKPTQAQEMKSLSDQQAHKPWDPQLQAEALAKMQAFMASAPEHGASLVVMGDSTMSGMLDDLLNIYPGMQGGAFMVHVTNDRPRGVTYNNHMPFVLPGEEWADPEYSEDALVQAVVKRAQNAVQVLHSQNCTWAGGVETLVVFEGPLKGLIVHHWGFIPEYGEMCWDSCYADAMKALQPQAIVWNIGLHLLNHDFDKATCEIRHNPSKKNCGDYEQLVKMGTSQLAQVVPKVIFRSTNWLCEDLQVAAFPLVGDKMRKWQDPAQRPALDEDCQSNCPWYHGLTCSDWVMEARATERMYNEALGGINSAKGEVGAELQSRIHLLDAFESTQTCCKTGCADGTVDGEHYRGLDKKLVHSLAGILAM